MPVAVNILVTRGNEAGAGIHGVGDVERRAKTREHGLNGPLELSKQHVEVGDGLILRLEAVDADQRETDTFDVNVMDFWVNKDVIDIEVKRRNVLRARWNRGGDDDGATGHITAVASEASSAVSGRGGGVECLSGELEVEVARGSIDEVVLGLNIDGDETLRTPVVLTDNSADLSYSGYSRPLRVSKPSCFGPWLYYCSQ